MTIPVEPEAAAALADLQKRVWIGQFVSRMLKPATADDVMNVMHRIADEAERRGLTDEILDAELQAYNAEGREPLPE